VFLALTDSRQDADRLRPLRCTESDRDLAYLIRTLLRFSAQRERGLSSPTSSAAASREKPGSPQSAPTVPAAGCRGRIGCKPSSRRIRAASWRYLAAAIGARSTHGTGRKPYTATGETIDRLSAMSAGALGGAASCWRPRAAVRQLLAAVSLSVDLDLPYDLVWARFDLAGAHARLAL